MAKCIKRAEALAVPLDTYANEELKQLLFPQTNPRNTAYRLPDFAYITEQMQKPNISLVLLWHRYAADCQAAGEQFYQQTQFYELYRRYRKQQNITIRIDRQPGEFLEIDWAEDALFLQDPVTGLKTKVYLFVAALSYSNYS